MKRLLLLAALAAVPVLVQAQTAPPTPPPTVAKKPFIGEGAGTTATTNITGCATTPARTRRCSPI